MTKACANKGGQPAPYTKYQKRPFDYTSLYRRHPNLRHWKHNPITTGFAASFKPLEDGPGENGK